MGSTLNSATNPWEYSLKRPHLEIWFFGDLPILVPSSKQKYILMDFVHFFYTKAFQIPVSCTGPLRLYINTLASPTSVQTADRASEEMWFFSSAPLLCGLNFEPLCVSKTCCHWYRNVLTIPSACQQTLFFFTFLDFYKFVSFWLFQPSVTSLSSFAKISSWGHCPSPQHCFPSPRSKGVNAGAFFNGNTVP